MNNLLDFVLLFLSQFSGGPSAPENNLVRFGLAAIFWGVLLAFAWSRPRSDVRLREQWLIYGFALGFCRELLMLIHASMRLLYPDNYQIACIIIEPIEHALLLAMVVVISGSFLRYILDDAHLAKRFLYAGLFVAVAEYLVTLLWWPRQLNLSSDFRFHQSWSAWLIHLIACVVITVAIAIMVQKRGWLRNVVVLALSSFLVSEFLVLVNLTLQSRYKSVLCPVSNTFYIWAIPLFGYVYFRELSIEKQQAEAALRLHQARLEEMVAARTSELIAANEKLKQTAVLEERQRIASDMHDGLAQTLTYLLIKTDEAVAIVRNNRSDQLVPILGNMQQTIDRATVDVRRVIASLSEAPQTRRSLQDLLTDLVERAAAEGSPTIQLQSDLHTPVYLIPAQREQITRIVSEALLNAVRHAQASEIRVQVATKADTLEVTVADDGCGFNPNDVTNAKSDRFGLNIMHARAAHLNGRLQIDSQPGTGTRVLLCWCPIFESQRGERPFASDLHAAIQRSSALGSIKI